MPEPCLKLWLPRQCWGTGIGDHLQILAVIPHWQKAHPGGRVIVAYEQMGTTPTIFGFPGVEYVESEGGPPDDEFIDAFACSPGPPRSAWWTKLGLDYFAPDKRFWYFPFTDELERADEVWGPGSRLRVVLQNRGGMHSKVWACVPRVTDLLVRHGVTVAVLDAVDEVKPVEPHIRIPRLGNLRDALAVVATAHLFVGFDSGPFYAAIGANVPSIAMFPYAWAPPESLYYPICTPKNIALCVAPDELPPGELCRDIASMLAPHGFDVEAFMADATELLGNTKARGWTLWKELPGYDAWVGWGEHEASVEEHLKIENGVFVDVGAHVGRYSIRAALRGVHVHAFEPNPRTREMLEANIELNGPLPNIAIYPVALGANPSEMTLSEFAGGSTLTATATDIRGDSRPYTVRVARLDDFNFERIDLLKIDVEGWENEVLRGAMNTIIRLKPRIVVEGHGCFDHYGGFRLTIETRRILKDLVVHYDIREVKYGEQTYFILNPKRRDPR